GRGLPSSCCSGLGESRRDLPHPRDRWADQDEESGRDVPEREQDEARGNAEELWHVVVGVARAVDELEHERRQHDPDEEADEGEQRRGDYSFAGGPGYYDGAGCDPSHDEHDEEGEEGHHEPQVS